MKRTLNHQHVPLVLGGIVALFLCGCSLLNGFRGNPNLDTEPVMSITMRNAYQGVGDGNVEQVPLPEDSAYLTVEICVENHSAIDQSVLWRNVFIIPEDREHVFPVEVGSILTTYPSAGWLEAFTSFQGADQIFPVAVGYDQAEAFSWLGPIVAPIGGKRIAHNYYFFVIQSNELMQVPAHQSLGCETSSQYKSLALLFIVPEENAGKPHILHFFDGEIRFVAKQNSQVSDGVKWGIGIGLFLILAVAIGFLLKRSRAKAQIAVAQADRIES